MLARLPDGRLLVGLPGNPLAALCAVITLTAHAGAAMLRGAAVADGFAAVSPGHGRTQQAVFTAF